MPVVPPFEDSANPEANDSLTETKVVVSSRNPDSKKVKPLKEASKMRKKPQHPPTSEMVLDSIKSLKMRKGASAEAIREYIMGKFKVGNRSMKPYINRFLKSGVEKGILERVSGEGPDGRFKIKKPDPIKKDNKQMVKRKAMVMKIKTKS